jgi:hypothetical protein
MTYWQFTAEYELKLKSARKMQNQDNVENSNITSADLHEGNSDCWEFCDLHPGRKFALLVKRKRICVPMIYYRDHLPDLEFCHIGTPDVDVHNETRLVRNDYATKALIMFYPFREISDLPVFNERWTFYCNAHEQGRLYWDSTRLLQNIQNIHNSKKLDPPDDPLNLELDDDDDDSSTDNSENDSPEPNSRLEENMQTSVEDMDILFEELVDVNQRNVCVNSKLFLKTQHQLLVPNFENKTLIMDNSFENISRSSHASDTPSPPPRNNGSQRKTVIQVIMDVTSMHSSMSNSFWTPSDINMPETSSPSNVVNTMDACIKHFKLDKKQAAAFNVITSSFMMTFLDDIAKSSSAVYNQSSFDAAKESLRGRGASANLKMMLTGPGGGGKSHVIAAVKAMCKYFCDATNQHFSSSVFIITASTNAAAAAIDGRTIHSVAQLRCSKASTKANNCDILWREARLIIIDETSMLSAEDWAKLDGNLRTLKKQSCSNPGNLYGGLHIIFCGDYYQLNPIGGTPVYNADRNIYWGEIDRCVILDIGNHRFKQDKRWGEILERMRVGAQTKADVDVINTRIVGKNIAIPTIEQLNGEDISYCCSKNRMRNVVSDTNFANILKATHPRKGSSAAAPLHTIIIKGLVADADDTPRSPAFHSGVFNGCGDADVEAPAGNEKVDPCLKLYKGCPIMVSVSDYKDTQGVVKGSTGKFAGLIFHEGCQPVEEIWDGHKVLTINVDEVEYVICEKKKKRSSNADMELATEYFKLPAKTFRVKMSLPLGAARKVYPEKSTLKLTQFPINIDLATTGHKLQGATKDNLVISDFNYGTANWVYVALSRVTKLSGLFLLKPLDGNKDFRPSQLLMAQMRQLERKEKATLAILQQNGHYPNDSADS